MRRLVNGSVFIRPAVHWATVASWALEVHPLACRKEGRLRCHVSTLLCSAVHKGRAHTVDPWNKEAFQFPAFFLHLESSCTLRVCLVPLFLVKGFPLCRCLSHFAPCTWRASRSMDGVNVVRERGRDSAGSMVTVVLMYDAAWTASRFTPMWHGGGKSTQRSVRRLGQKLVVRKEEKQ